MKTFECLTLLPLMIALAGCSSAAPSAPAAAPAPESAGVTPSSSASASPKPVWSVPPPVTPGSYATPAASACAALTSCTTAPGAVSTTGITVTGAVYGSQGLPLYGAGVSIQSLDPKRPFSNRVIAPKGLYTFTNVPAGCMIKVAGNLRGYEPRSVMATTPNEPTAEPFRVDLMGAFALPKIGE